MLLREGPLNYRRRAGVTRPRKAPPAPPLQTLVLVSASYDDSGLLLFLTFDRAVDASGFVGAQVTVYDGSINSHVYAGTGPATIVSPIMIQVALVITGPASLAPVTLTATALSGIVAVDDGGTWAGVNELGLPFDG